MILFIFLNLFFTDFVQKNRKPLLEFNGDKAQFNVDALENLVLLTEVSRKYLQFCYVTLCDYLKTAFDVIKVEHCSNDKIKYDFILLSFIKLFCRRWLSFVKILSFLFTAYISCNRAYGMLSSNPEADQIRLE